MARYRDAPKPQHQRARNHCAWCGDLLIMAHCRGALDNPCDQNGYGHAAYPCGMGSDQCCKCQRAEIEVLWQLRQDERVVTA
jgi:hypothetical protein